MSASVFVIVSMNSFGQKYSYKLLLDCMCDVCLKVTPMGSVMEELEEYHNILYLSKMLMLPTCFSLSALNVGVIVTRTFLHSSSSSDNRLFLEKIDWLPILYKHI